MYADFFRVQGKPLCLKPSHGTLTTSILRNNRSSVRKEFSKTMTATDPWYRWATIPSLERGGARSGGKFPCRMFDLEEDRMALAATNYLVTCLTISPETRYMSRVVSPYPG